LKVCGAKLVELGKFLVGKFCEFAESLVRRAGKHAVEQQNLVEQAIPKQVFDEQ